MAERKKMWMPMDTWDALVRGDSCALCEIIQSKAESDEYGFVVRDLAMSRLRLSRNQFVRGYCVLVSRIHTKEWFYLADKERLAFFDDLTWAARAVEKVFSPIKMNFTVLGNQVPHLHVHLIPRYHGDPAPESPIDPAAEHKELSRNDYAEMLQELRAALAAASSSA